MLSKLTLDLCCRKYEGKDYDTFTDTIMLPPFTTPKPDILHFTYTPLTLISLVIVYQVYMFSKPYFITGIKCIIVRQGLFCT